MLTDAAGPCCAGARYNGHICATCPTLMEKKTTRHASTHHFLHGLRLEWNCMLLLLDASKTALTRGFFEAGLTLVPVVRGFLPPDE